MSAHAIFFGAIGTIVETSDMQRRAFNRAFITHGLDWHWDEETYGELLKASGGVGRINAYANGLGDTVDAKAVHATKVQHFAQMMADDGLSLRPGVRNLIDAAHASGQKVGFVTSTGADQSQAIFDALGDALSRDDFDYIGDASRVTSGKPAPDIYLDALDALNLSARDVIAIEDSPVSARASLAANIETYGFVGKAHLGNEFPNAVKVVTSLDPQMIMGSLMATD